MISLGNAVAWVGIFARLTGRAAASWVRGWREGSGPDERIPVGLSVASKNDIARQIDAAARPFPPPPTTPPRGEVPLMEEVLRMDPSRPKPPPRPRGRLAK